MYKTYDVQCDECNEIEEVFIDDKEEFPVCSICGGKVRRIFLNMNFKLIYCNKTDTCSWGDHGYASSQYWSQVKKQRAEGKDVKGIDE